MDLLRFLEELRQLLWRIADQAEQLGLSAGDARRLREAWREVEPLLEDMRGMVASGSFEEELRRHGLTGAQLEFKLEPFARVLRALEAEERRPRPRGILGRARDALKRFLGGVPIGPVFWLRKALEKADVVLESLAEALQVGGALTEFKKGVESLLGDLLDAREWASSES
jgi:hypothetical protein